jgi:RNA polymerase sigma factor for flagellar operon FliA
MANQREKRTSTEETLALWKEYKATGDTRLRDRLVLTLAPMVKYIVFRKVREIPARCEVEDFISCGLEALLRSIDRYDPSRGASLEQYVWRRIQGAVLDELRRNDWAPRSLRRSEREIARARERFVTAHGRAPSRRELSEALGVSANALDRRLDDVGRADVTSLNVLVAGDEEMAIERIDTLPCHDIDCDPEHSAFVDQAKVRFRAAFSRLPERDRRVAVLLYVHELTLREVGEILGVTESRVSQIHAELRKRLRGQLAAEEELLAQVA